MSNSAVRKNIKHIHVSGRSVKKIPPFGQMDFRNDTRVVSLKFLKV